MVNSNPNRDDDPRELLAFRVPRELATEVRDLARREAESQASILRRLIRAGLTLERGAMVVRRG